MKLKEKTKKKIRGSITVLLIILMLPSMTLSAVVVDSSRINMARSMVSNAGDLAMNTALANYDTILKDVYGLFAMSQDKSDDELADELRDYFATTLVSYGVVNEAESGEYVDALIGDFKELIANSKNGKPSNMLDMKVDKFTVTRVENSSLADPAILRSQIVEYMKYRAPLEFGLSFLDSVNAFKNVQDQTTVVQSQVAAQEKVQDVTEACQKVIEAIRDYDKLMGTINEEGGTSAVIGKAHKADGKIVGVGEYHTQVDKYYSTWGDNYKHANMLTLVFLLKPPSVNSLYLKSISGDFINSDTDNPSVKYTDSGINISPSVASTTSEAKSQVDSQINKLLNKSNLEYKTAEAYEKKDYLSTTYITSTANAFKNETAAVNTFIEFEKFLNNEGSLKYSNLKTTFEAIYTLGKYYDNYYSKISTAISNAKNDMDVANGKVSTANSNASTYKNNISWSVTKINEANKNYDSTYDFLTGIINSNSEDLGVVVANLMAQTAFKIPTATSNEGGKSFTKFSGFVNTFKENSSDVDNQYLKVFKEIISSSLRSDETYGSICVTASSYLSDKASGKTSKSFSNYVKEKLGSDSLNNDLFKLLNHLYTNNRYVDDIKYQISFYDNVKNGYKDLVDKANQTTQEYNNKVTERDSVKASYANCLSKYSACEKAYRLDLDFYGKYIETAKVVIGTEVSAINGQFTQIKNNVKSLIDQLGVIEDKLSDAKEFIETYNDELDKWQQANTTYQNNNGSDSFSKQNAADAQTSKQQYNIESLNTLTAYVGAIKGELNDFYTRITDNTHFKYGSKKIDTITIAEHMKSAIPASVKDSLPTVVTVETANSKLSTLYKNDATGSIEMEWYFLKPKALQIQFLKYLNETYPETAPTTSQSVMMGDEVVNVGNGEKDYKFENAKEDLKENTGGSVSDKTDVNVFGYSYKDEKINTINTADMPSKGVGKKTVTEQEYGIKEDSKDEKDLDVSSGFDNQNSVLGTILAGINDVAENTLENTYILSYIFNNFSYNTLIQDAVIEKEKDKVNGLPAEALLAARDLNSDTSEGSTLSKTKDTTTTLSNYIKNSKNNRFYGAEIEYLLFGNGNAVQNVKYTKASIYALRFAFNSIYAFTNSEIRNSTMSVGLAVQAATMGIVPYQIVQIVLQLALAAAESAVDLDMMNNGLKVAIVKTNDTWSLSISSAVKSASKMATDAAIRVTGKAISSVASGLQGIVDAGADELNGSIKDLSTNLTEATSGKIQEVMDSAFGIIQSKIEDGLNKLQYTEFYNKKENIKVDVTEKINEIFAEAEAQINAELSSTFSGNPVADAVLPHITGEISTIIGSVKDDLTNMLEDVDAPDVGDVVAKEMTKIKLNLIEYTSDVIDYVNGNITSVADELTKDVKDKLDGYIEKSAGELTEAASKEIKENVTQVTNDFIKDYLDNDSATTVGSEAAGKTSSSVASIIKFGYKDYLMLFVFIALSVSDETDPVVARIADVIEMNVKHAAKTSGDFKHKQVDNFKIENAKTYVSIHAETQLDMLFMNLDFFTNILVDDETEVSGQLTPAATIEYNGLFGY